MSTLLLVRHGQAHAFDADSDRLTSRGEEQARAFGESLLGTGEAIDAIVTGSLVRQIRTQEIAGEVLRAAGRPWPEPIVDPRWNEYDAGGILGSLLPALREKEQSFAERVRAFEDAAGGPERNRYFQRMFEELMDAWSSGGFDVSGVEPFAAFHERVRAAFEAVRAMRGKRRIAVFTSGGPIGVCVQHALEAPTKQALRLNWRVKNGSVTEFLSSEGRLSLDGFNSVEHLGAPLRTFR
jgi:broad specificity phosphatase PhoE